MRPLHSPESLLTFWRSHRQCHLLEEPSYFLDVIKTDDDIHWAAVRKDKAQFQFLLITS
jgi:hypothetical protein